MSRNPSDQEKLDQEALKAWIVERKIQAFEYGRQIATLPADQLKHYGYTNREHGLTNVFTTAMREIEKRVQAHERKYPDAD